MKKNSLLLCLLLLKRQLVIGILLFPAVFILTGCLQLTVETGVDRNFTSYLSYKVEIDTEKAGFQYHDIIADALNNLGWYYQEHNEFTVGINTETDIYTLSMYKSIDNNNLPEAFTSLEYMLTDEDITLFMLVDMYLEILPRTESYFISAMIDIPQIISLSSAVELPEDVLNQLEEGLETSGGTILLTVPASQVDSHSHDIDISYRLATMTVPISFDSKTGLELLGSVIYSDNGIQIGSFEETINENEQKRETALIAGGCIVTLLFIILLVTLLKIRKHNKLYD